MYYEQLIAKAESSYESGDLTQALSYLLEALEIVEDPELMIEIAIVYDELNEIDKAKTYYKLAIELDNQNARAYYGLGTIYDNQLEIEKALSYYEEAIFYQPDYPEAHFFSANLYDDLGKRDLAIYHYELTIKYRPDYFYAYLNLGSIYESMNELKIALDLFLKAESINTNNHLLYFNFGVVYRKLGRLKDSILAYETSLKISIDYPYAYLNLAIIYKDDYQDLTKAIEVYSEGIKHHQETSVLFYNRACAYALLNKFELAIKDLERAINLSPDLKNYADKDPELDALRQSNLY